MYENFFFTVYRVLGAVIDRNFTQIGNIQALLKNLRKLMMVFCHISTKGLRQKLIARLSYSI
jgi:hypothetical protein